MASPIPGYPGYEGWDPVAAQADFKATGGTGKGGPAGGAGDGRAVESVDLSQVPSVTGFVQGQFPAEDQALRDLVMQMRSREQPQDIYGRLETEAGLPELRRTSTTLSKEIANIEDYLQQIEPDVSARTRESLVTEAQRRGMVAEGREPFLQKLGKFATSLGRVGEQISGAERGIATKTELALKGQEMNLEPLELRYKTLIERNSRLLTGFQVDRSTQLDILMDKLQRTRQLSDMEYQQVNELAKEERTYIQGLQETAAKLGVKLTGNESTDTILNALGIEAARQTGFEENIQLREQVLKERTEGRLGKKEDVTEDYENELLQSYFTAENNTPGSGKSAMWQYIHSIEPLAQQRGIDTTRLWNIYNNM